MKASAILETCLYVDDLVAAERFYADVLGLERVAAEPGRHVFFRCGPAMLLLFNPEATEAFDFDNDDIDVPPHGTHGHGHAAFRAEESELDAWRTHLHSHNISIETEINWPNGGRSIYFRDPAGNSLEFATPKLWGL